MLCEKSVCALHCSSSFCQADRGGFDGTPLETNGQYLVMTGASLLIGGPTSRNTKLNPRELYVGIGFFDLSSREKCIRISHEYSNKKIWCHLHPSQDKKSMITSEVSMKLAR
ncbi:hypothetical protein CLAIMM_15102 [Cladophialophora immunda]|nr:hypothetical protein CLAIMM_15102 [Cladophialophora immunda]